MRLWRDDEYPLSHPDLSREGRDFSLLLNLIYVEFISTYYLSHIMPTARQWILVISNIIIAASIAYHVFSGGSANQSGSNAVKVDLEPLAKPIASLEESIGGLTHNFNRLNTSLIQYDFLQKDIARLSELDQAVAVRLNQELTNKAQAGENPTTEIDEVIGQIQQFKEQVQKELEQRRQMLMQLISNLEQNLAASDPDKDATHEVIGDSSAQDGPNLDMSLPATIPNGQ